MHRSQVGNSLKLAWRRGLVLRTAEPIYEAERINKERGGVSSHVRPFHLYLKARRARRVHDICGWDRETGIPTKEKLAELGLAKIGVN